MPKKYRLNDKHMILVRDDEYLAIVAQGLISKDKIIEGKTIKGASQDCQFSRALEGHEELTIGELLETLPIKWVVDIRLKANDFMANEVKEKCLEQVVTRGNEDLTIHYYENVDLIPTERSTLTLILGLIDYQKPSDRKLLTAAKKEENRLSKIAARTQRRQEIKSLERSFYIRPQDMIL